MASKALESYSKKYLNQEVEVHIDRLLGSAHPTHGFIYEVNYGFIPNTKAPDGEELDAYVLGVDTPIQKFTGICIAIIHRINDNDDKLIVVPPGTILSEKEIRKATYFQEQYFQSEIFQA